MTEPKPIPVKEAARIGREFEKSAVIVIGWEPATQLTHVATWGANAEAKLVAAAAGERVSKLLTGADTRQFYEDFRQQAPDHALILDLAAHLGLSCEQTTEGILRAAIERLKRPPLCPNHERGDKPLCPDCLRHALETGEYV